MGIKYPCLVILKYFMRKKNCFPKKIMSFSITIVNHWSIALILSFPHLKLEFTKIMKVLHLVNYYWFKKNKTSRAKINK